MILLTNITFLFYIISVDYDVQCLSLCNVEAFFALFYSTFCGVLLRSLGGGGVTSQSPAGQKVPDRRVSSGAAPGQMGSPKKVIFRKYI